jgi:DNA helicase II / ATP-dependent DNA helicase PcrA
MINFEKELNKEQQKVVYEGDGPCLVLSGPGSGKTRTLVYRTAYLLQNGVPPSRILLLTFTKKAAREMLSRIQSLFPFAEKEMEGGTFHHVGNIILKKYAEKLGYQKNFVILDEDDAKTVIKSILIEKQKLELPKASVIQKIISLSKNSKISIEKIIENYFPYFSEDIVSEIEEVDKTYQTRKKKHNLMDFDDLLLNWAKLLSIKEVGEEIANNFLYVMVDEYQDTNTIQDEIIKKISKKHKNILVVGDDAQSIYSFRAANIENIISFKEKYPQAKIFKLEANYRSVPEILDVANKVIENNEKKLDKKLYSTKEKGRNPVIVPLSNPIEQARYITNYLKNERDLSKTAVLFRAHFHSVELEMELVKNKIPYILRGGVRFFEQFHVKDVVAFLRIYINYFDETSWKRILLRQEGIGEINSKRVIKRIFEKESINELLLNKEDILSSFSSLKVKEGIEKIFELLEKGNSVNASEKINLFLKNFYNHYLDFSFDNAKERKGDLKRIVEISYKYEDLDEMISDFSLSEDFQKEEKSKNAVVLSTIHQAKGLEWETVFVISLREGGFPHSKSLEENMIEEERRLFYVAITRCKENLFLTYPLYDFRDKEVSIPSRFLKEAGLIEIENYDDEEIVKDESQWETF